MLCIVFLAVNDLHPVHFLVHSGIENISKFNLTSLGQDDTLSRLEITEQLEA